MEPWNERRRPACLEKRFEFDSYSSTRDFLDRLGDFSEQRERYPDISFGKTYVNITLRPEEDAEEAILTDTDHAFAAAIDGLVD